MQITSDSQKLRPAIEALGSAQGCGAPVQFHNLRAWEARFFSQKPAVVALTAAPLLAALGGDRTPKEAQELEETQISESTCSGCHAGPLVASKQPQKSGARDAEHQRAKDIRRV